MMGKKERILRRKLVVEKKKLETSNEGAQDVKKSDDHTFPELLQVNIQSAVLKAVQESGRDDDRDTINLIVQGLLLSVAPFALNNRITRAGFCSAAGETYDQVREQLVRMGIPVPPGDISVNDGSHALAGHKPTFSLGVDPVLGEDPDPHQF